MWAFRQPDEDLYICDKKPIFDEEFKDFIVPDMYTQTMFIRNDTLDWITYENSPQEIDIIKKINE